VPLRSGPRLSKRERPFGARLLVRSAQALVLSCLSRGGPALLSYAVSPVS